VASLSTNSPQGSRDRNFSKSLGHFPEYDVIGGSELAISDFGAGVQDQRKDMRHVKNSELSSSIETLGLGKIPISLPIGRVR